ncbi:MAG: ChbG/HpnK family deacetylase, partial [Caldimonas sp.]
MTRALALCADDYGAARGIDDAIVELAAAGRLSAVSCLANGEHWNGDAPALRAVLGRADIGLHFNLSEGRPLSHELARAWPRLPALPRLIALAHLGVLPLAAIHAELACQLEVFTTAIGAAPRFVDGHQHVHHLPGVRGIVLETIERMRPMPALRN